MGKSETLMAQKLCKKAYINYRCSGKVIIYERSRLKIERQLLPNRLDFFSKKSNLAGVAQLSSIKTK